MIRGGEALAKKKKKKITAPPARKIDQPGKKLLAKANTEFDIARPRYEKGTRMWNIGSTQL